jgi:RND family efflux transporter MFP subunit
VQATGEHFTGKITRFTDSLDMSTRTMQVEIDVPNKDYHLQPGMYADVHLSSNVQANALTVPIEAVIRGENQNSVLVVDAQDKVQTREVKIGIESSNKVEIVSGLSEGERVIVGNMGTFQPGELVKPRPAALSSEASAASAE